MLRIQNRGKITEIKNYLAPIQCFDSINTVIYNDYRLHHVLAYLSKITTFTVRNMHVKLIVILKHITL